MILFGAGKSGENFIRQNQGLDIIAVADNDESKQGGLFCGLPVISPSGIAETGCELIVITSVWAKTILKQLSDLGLDSIETYIPGKREMKGMRDVHPFSHPLTKAVASEMCLALNQMAQAEGIDLYLDFGTLLGAVREKDFIAWDDDVDFSVNDDQFEKWAALIQSRKHTLPGRSGITWDVDMMSVGSIGASILFTCRNVSEDLIVPFELGVSRRVRKSGRSVVFGSMPEFYSPDHHFEGFETIEFLGQDFKTPRDRAAYLTFLYGDWGTPRQETAFAEYPASEVDFVDYKVTVTPIS